MASPFQILVFSGTAAYRHASIPAGIAAIRRLSTESSATSTPFTAVFTEDPAVFTPESLSTFKVVVFLQSSGEFLTSTSQLDALKGFVRSGGGVVGVHCATFAMESSEWYGRLMGAVFHSHPEPQLDRIRFVDPLHPIFADSPWKGGGMHVLINSKQGLRQGRPKSEWVWNWVDEWYLFKQSPQDITEAVHVLMAGGMHGKDHPIAWCQEFEGGRSFYTSLGHFDEAYEDDGFLAQLLGGILWVAGAR